jgi:serine/threonine protein kinase
MHIKYIDLGLSCTRKKCNDFAGTPLYLIPEIKFPKSGLNEAAAKLNVSTVPINFDTYVMADYWALGITMIEYILGEDYFVELLDKRGIEPKDMIRYLPTRFVSQYPDVVASLSMMVADIPARRRLPTIRFSQ